VESDRKLLKKEVDIILEHLFPIDQNLLKIVKNLDIGNLIKLYLQGENVLLLLLKEKQDIILL
jgi:hypothetical protein